MSETYKGVFVSSLAKKHVISTFIKIYAGKPREKIDKTWAVYIVSSGKKAPLSNRIWIMGLDKINKPAADGKEINKENSSERFWAMFISTLFSFLIAFDKLGSKTTPMAIPNIAKGNWFKRSA